MEKTSRRSAAEAKLDVLNAVKMGYEKPTRIMYAANTDWARTKRYLAELIAEGYVEMMKKDMRSSKSHNPRLVEMYSITLKGEQLLKDARKVFKLLSSSLMDGGCGEVIR